MRDRFDAVIASARARKRGEASTPSPRQIAAIVGSWYRAEAALWADDPGDPLRWETRAPESEAPHAAVEFAPDPHILRDTKDRLRADGFIPNRETLIRAAEAWASAQISLAAVMEARAAGDWRPDPNLTRFPELARCAAPASVAVPIAALVAGWARDNGKAHKARYEREQTAKGLVRFLGHDDAARVVVEDVVRWKETRLAANVSPKTIRNDIAEMSAIWRWARTNRKLHCAENPFAGISPPKPKTSKRARGPYDAAEAKRLLLGARSAPGFLRWLPWLLCFTGARLGEVTQATKDDVKRHGADGLWFIHIHEQGEGRSLKNPHSERLVPLHPALIAEGFLEHVRNLPPGSPLFADVKPDSFGKRAGTATKNHARWIRKVVGITDTLKDPAHAWRHLFEDRARMANVPQHVMFALTGHLEATNESARYGRGLRFMPDVTAEWVAKMASPLGTVEIATSLASQ